MLHFLTMLTEAATVAPEVAAQAAPMPLFTRGLIVTGIGLCGVFLVLTLYFFTIKLIQRAKDKDA